MERAQAPLATGEKGHDIPFSVPNNPHVPAKSNVCFINNLPAELLCRIFEWSSTDDDPAEAEGVNFWTRFLEETGSESSEEGGDGDDTDESSGGDWEIIGPYPPTGCPPPVLISHVCHLWRNIAFSSPSLWTRLEAGLKAGRTYKLESMLLEQSKDLPIDVIISSRYYGFSVEAPSYDDFRPLVSIMVPHIHRWHTIEVHVEEYSLMYNFLCAVSDPSIPAAPQLTTLHLTYYPWRDLREYDDDDESHHPSPPKHLIPFGGSVPLLTTLCLRGVHVDWSQPWIASAPNLTYLSLRYHGEDRRPSWAQFAAILRGAPGLRELRLCRSGPSGHPSEWFIKSTPRRSADLNAPIQLLRLTNLTLESISQERAIGLLRKLYLPALNSLRFDFECQNCTDFVLELTRPATSLSPGQPSSLSSRLESLRVSRSYCSNESVRVLYSELQNVTSLTMDAFLLSSEFLDFLGTGSTGTSAVWLPRLTALYICMVDGGHLRRVLQERMDAGAPLTALYVSVFARVSNQEVEWFQENLELGWWHGK